MAKARKVKGRFETTPPVPNPLDPSLPPVRYARLEDVRKVAEKIFKSRPELFRRLAEYERAHPPG